MIETNLARIAASFERIAAALEAIATQPRSPSEMTPSVAAPEDLLVGAEEIARETGIKVRQVYRLSELGDLPTFKLGGQLAARRSELERALSANSGRTQ
jgi:hypothetical protein